MKLRKDIHFNKNLIFFKNFIKKYKFNKFSFMILKLNIFFLLNIYIYHLKVYFKDYIKKNKKYFFSNLSN